MSKPELNIRAARKRNDRIPLTAIEQRVYDLCAIAAATNQPAPSVEALTIAIGASGPSTVPGIMKRLEVKGWISRTIYQRGRQVCITETGQCTVPPRCLAPHWRTRPATDPVPTPAIHSVREREHPTAMQIEQEARALGKPVAAFLADLVYIGFHAYRAEQEQG